MRARHAGICLRSPLSPRAAAHKYPGSRPGTKTGLHPYMYAPTYRPVISSAIKEGERSRIVRVMANSSRARQGVCMESNVALLRCMDQAHGASAQAKYSTAVLEIRNCKHVWRV